MTRASVVAVALALFFVGAPAAGQTLSFIDANGEPVETYAEGTTAYLRLDHPAGNVHSGSIQQMDIWLSSLLAGDGESLLLTETGLDTGIFEGSIELAPQVPLGRVGVLETTTDEGPPFTRDTIQADFNLGAAVTSADMVGSLTVFVDAYGQPTDGVPAEGRAYLRIVDTEIDDPATFDTAQVTITALGSGDVEVLQLAETGLATGTFEGSVPVGSGPSPGDGVLDAGFGETVEAQHSHLSTPDSSSDQISVVGSQTILVDAAGEPVDEIYEGTIAYLNVIDPSANVDSLNTDFTTASLDALITGDSESVSLTETGPDTGIFAGAMDVDSTVAVLGNGFLETDQIEGPPVVFDTITASYSDAYGQSSDSASTIGARIEFIDAFGAKVNAFAAGSRVYLRAEDHDALDYVVLELSASGGDSENAYLIETSPSSGVYEGFLELQDGAAISLYDGLLQAAAGEQLNASYYETFGYSTSTALAIVTASRIDFVDADGNPTLEILEGSTARVRLFSIGDNADPAVAETVNVNLQSSWGLDFEILTLTETGLDTNVFEGSISLVTGGSGTNLDGVLTTSTSGPPDYAFDELVVNNGTSQAVASTTGSRTLFIDAFGNEVESFVAGDTVAVRVIDFNVNDPLSVDTTQVGIAGLSSGDSETLSLTETGNDTGVFEGSVALGPGSSADDGLLDVGLGETIEAIHNHSASPGVSMDQATIAGSATYFIDAAGAQTSEYLQGAPAIVRVVDHAANQSPSNTELTTVQLTSAVTGDFESLDLYETGVDTGIFEGSIPTVLLATAQSGNGVLETYEDFSGPDPRDTITAIYSDTFSQSTAVATTIGSRLVFIDAAGGLASSYATGSRAYLRVEDQNVNNPGVFDSVMVSVTSSIGDNQDVFLQETGKTTGIYEGYVQLADEPFADPFNGTLETQAGGQIDASYSQAAGSSAYTSANITGQDVKFVDAAGLPTAELLEGDVARFRVTSVADNQDPGAVESVSVTLTSSYGADTESLQLQETELDSGLFEGVIATLWIDPVTTTGTPGNGVLETSNSYIPLSLPDQVTVSFGGDSAVATTVGARLAFIDAFGQDTESYAEGSEVILRVISYVGNDAGSIDSAFVDLTALSGGDVEPVQLYETGFDTAVFEGSISLGPGASSYDGLLDASAGEQIEALHYTYSGTTPLPVDLATVGGSETFFVDADGELAVEYLQGAPAYVRVIDNAANQSSSNTEVTSVQLTSEVTGDFETLSLFETGPDSGIFEGSIPTRLGSSQPGDGVLDTNENQSSPERHDTLTATYSDTFSQSVATARTLGSRLIFIDSAGNPAASYATGGTAILRVEDQNLNDPGVIEFVMVSMSSSLGDNQDAFLQETGKSTGIYEGTVNLIDDPSPDAFNGTLETQAGGEIYASYSEAAGSNSFASAEITGTGVEFLDAAGLPTSQLLESHVARVRVTSASDDVDPMTIDSLTVSLGSLYAADSESLLLTETYSNSGVFEGEIALAFVAPPGGAGTPGNGVVETSNSHDPAFLGEQVTASYGGQSATAVTVGMRLDFIDIFGQATEAYAESGAVILRIVNPTINDPGAIDVIDATVSVLGGSGDVEQVLLNETGFDTAVYEGQIALGAGSSQFDGLLDASSGDLIEARRAATTGTLPDAVDLAMIGGSETFFIDATGELTSEYLQGAPAFVRVIDHAANQDPLSSDVTSVSLSSEVTGDFETLSLYETEPDSGIFEGSIVTRLGSSQPSDGVLDTNENQSSPERLDVITATYSDTFGQSSATARTLGSRLIFIDSAGNPATSYATGGTAILRVEDQNVNDPGVIEFVMVSMSSSLGDNQDAFLQETGKSTGIYEGTVNLIDDPSPDAFNGTLETQAGGEIYASYSEAAGSNSFASAEITGTGVEFLDAAGLPTSQLLESHVARVRVTSASDDVDPMLVDSLTVSLGSLYATDSESLLLTETYSNSGVFEGEIALVFVAPPGGTGTPGNGVVETSNSHDPAFLGEQVTASYGGQSATAVTVGLRLEFVDIFGQDTEFYAASDQVTVRIVNHTINDPGAVDVIDATVSVIGGSGDVEQVLLNETGFDTAVYEGQIALGAGSSQFDGLLDASSGDLIEARRAATTGTLPDAVDLAMIGGSETFFIDSAGELTAEYLQGAPAYVRVIDHVANQDPSSSDVTSVSLSSEVTGDFETLSLYETGPDSGIFEGSIVTRLGSSQPGDGVLDTNENQSSPERLDVITATYSDAFGQSSATARTLGSRLIFIDSAGNPAASYATGGTAILRVEDQNVNDPGVIEFVMVSMSSSLGDNQDAFLQETGKSTGIYEGTVNLIDDPSPDAFNGTLETQAGGEIYASYSEAAGSNSFASAEITGTGVEFLDAAGLPTSQLLESHVARVRVTSASDDVDPMLVDSLTVSLGSLYATDSESLLLTETYSNSGVFEGEIALVFVAPPGGTGTPGNGVVETSNSHDPAFLGEQVTASYGGQSATAVTVGLRLEFVDIFGQDTEFYAASDQVTVRIVNHTINDPGAVDVIDATVSVIGGSGDVEQVLLNETGVDTAVYEGQIALGTGSSQFDGLLDAAPGDQIEARRAATSGTLPDAVDLATIGGSETFFVDAAGQVTAEYLQASEAFVRVTDHAANQDPISIDITTVQLATELTGDSESLTLYETGVDTGLFTGSIDLAVGPTATPGDGLLTTDVASGPTAFDTLTATYSDAFGQSLAAASTLGSRIAFIDGLGVEISAIDSGLPAVLRVEDHAANDPGQADTVMASVNSSDTGDQLDVYLFETGLDTGVFEGQITLDENPVADTFDGVLQTVVGDQVFASHNDAYGTFSSYVNVDVVVPSNFPPSVSITAPADSSVFVAADAITFTGSASDPEEGDLSSGLTWTSDLDGTIGSGGSFSVNLSIGTHYITATVVDSGGRQGQDVVSIVVDNTPPVPSIITPADGAILEFGTSVELTGTANDFEDGDLSSSVEWWSDIDGMIGTGSTVFTSSLSEGVHLITARVTDSGGISGYASVNVTVESPNTAPVVDISAPNESAVFVAADAIAFAATASDLEDGDLGASLSWTSDLDGAIGSGESFSANLSIGAHAITASVTDSGGLTGTFVVNIQVNNTPPSVTISAPTDGSTFNAGDSIDFTATANDYEDGDLTVNLDWSSDVDGSIGASGGSISVSSLSVGVHVITALVIDSGSVQGTDTITITVNAGPSVSITSPADGSAFNAGDAVSFVGTASDPEDGDLTASLSWSSDVDGAIGTGGTFSTSALSAGPHVITATVSDAGGLSGNASITLTVNAGPSVSITSPADGSGFNAGDAVSFVGTASDPEDGDLTTNLSWSSDVDGAIGTGGTFSTSALSAGPHVITATVSDAGGLSGDASITLTVNAGPSVSITSPADGSGFNAGDAVSFVGTASDPEDGDLTASLSWSSDVDGAIGTGGTFSTSALSAGPHVITATVSDAGGLSGNASITLTVNAGPSVSITSPADGSGFNAGDAVSFVGTASDPEDGDLTTSLSWSSDVDGAIGTGATFSTSVLSAGPHVITATVSDAGGLSGNASITITVNAGPSVLITSPADGSGFNVGDSVSFVGTASDPEDGDLTSSLSWSSDVDGAIGTGGTFSTSALSAGPHVITGTVSDAGGLSGDASITLTVNAGPSVSITSPADGSGFNVGDSVSFVGTANDPEDGDLTTSLSWSSDVDGAIGTGGTFSTSALSAGPHVITGTVSDVGGLSGDASITLTVNAGPSVSITSPADGSGFNVGDSVSFVGTASDPEDGDLTSSLSWSSDVDGAIGTGGTFSTSALSAGTHVITATVSDAGGLSGNASITLTVNAGPSASITSPADGSIFDQGDSITFSGTAADPEDGDLSAGLTWTSDLDGVIGSGGSFSTSTLSLGTHTVTASVNDSGGLSAVAAITLTVKLPPVQIVLTSIGGDDGWVRESNESSNVGGRKNNTGSGSSALRPGDHKKDRQYKAIVSFDTSAIPDGATILSADLRLLRGNLKGTNPFTTHGTCWVDIQTGGFGGSTDLANGDFEAAATASQVASLSNAASNGDWSEGSLNAAGLGAIDTTGTTQMRIYFDLDDNDDGGDDYIGYYSGDNSNSSRHPQLVVVYQP